MAKDGRTGLGGSSTPCFESSFFSSLDIAHIASLLDTLDLRSTLFVVARKTFSTQEAMLNGCSVREWLKAAAGAEWQRALPLHFVAVSSEVDKVFAFGLPENNLFQMWDWAGGAVTLAGRRYFDCIFDWYGWS